MISPPSWFWKIYLSYVSWWGFHHWRADYWPVSMNESEEACLCFQPSVFRLWHLLLWCASRNQTDRWGRVHFLNIVGVMLFAKLKEMNRCVFKSTTVWRGLQDRNWACQATHAYETLLRIESQCKTRVLQWRMKNCVSLGNTARQVAGIVSKASLRNSEAQWECHLLRMLSRSVTCTHCTYQ
jgi:hypothetical protein